MVLSIQVLLAACSLAVISGTATAQDTPKTGHRIIGDSISFNSGVYKDITLSRVQWDSIMKLNSAYDTRVAAFQREKGEPMTYAEHEEFVRRHYAEIRAVLNPRQWETFDRYAAERRKSNAEMMAKAKRR